ncbi:MAG: hypothetical protein U5L95_01570 [Candidatus Saccharibacteria bacterium]|nr:hypothetical protein [Candidatus Saccharibacteria bacterium]
MKNTILVMSWVTILTISLFVVSVGVYDSRAEQSKADRDNHIRLLSKACSEQVNERFSTSGDANIKDIYSYRTPEEVFLAKHAAQLDCVTRYPLEY